MNKTKPADLIVNRNFFEFDSPPARQNHTVHVWINAARISALFEHRPVGLRGLCCRGLLGLLGNAHCYYCNIRRLARVNISPAFQTGRWDIHKRINIKKMNKLYLQLLLTVYERAFFDCWAIGWNYRDSAGSQNPKIGQRDNRAGSRETRESCGDSPPSNVCVCVCVCVCTRAHPSTLVKTSGDEALFRCRRFVIRG